MTPERVTTRRFEGETHVLMPAGLGLGLDRVRGRDTHRQRSFTDGLSEAMNDKAELFGENRLRRIEGALGLEIASEERILLGAPLLPALSR